MSQRAFGLDTFTESSNTALSAHTAEIGGATWNVTSANFTVVGGSGYVAVSGGVANTCTLTGSSTGNGWVLGGGVNRTGSAANGGVTIRNVIDGATWNRHLYLALVNTTQIVLYRRTSGTFTSLVTTSKNSTFPINVRFQATGSSATSLQARKWDVGSAEPDGWDATTTDNTALNQTASPAPVGIYLEGNTAATDSYSISELTAADTVPDRVTKLRAVTRAAVF